MKSSDIALVILIALISFGVSYGVINIFMPNPSEKVEKIDYIQDISAIIEEPDHETFNAYALNLNEDVRVGKCEYGTVWNGLNCVLAGSEDDSNGENNENTENNENNENPEENNPSE